MTDQRPDPKPRKLARLWQSYLWWDELNQLWQKHDKRRQSAEAGKSNYDAQFEQDMIELTHLEEFMEIARKDMVKYGTTAGPIWDWVTSVKGCGAGGDAAKLLAQIDDITKFDTISKLWRFAGWAVIDGEIDKPRRGEKLSYNRTLKSICWRIADQFVRQRTPVYRDEYDRYREEDRRNHPNVICQKCGTLFDPEIKRCPGCKAKNTSYNLLYCNAHMDARARRKIAKLFLAHLWLKWRELEGLPTSDPYVEAILGHTHIVPVPEFS